MSLFDWNGGSNNHASRSGRGISIFGAIVATVERMFLATAIIALFGDGEDTPVFIIFVLWIVCGSGLGAWFDWVGI